MQEIVTNVLDRRLIHALQISPRAPWSALASVVGTNATTLARRWETMVGQGLCWTFGYPPAGGSERMAIVEIDVNPGQVHAITADLCRLSAVASVDSLASGASLVVTVLETSSDGLAQFLLDVLPTLPHIRRVNAHLLTGYVRIAERWSLRELSELEVRSIPPAPMPRTRAPRTVSTALENTVFACLGRDARTPAAEIARLAGVSPQRSQDAISLMLHNGTCRLRTDVINKYSGWPIHVWYFVDVEAASLHELSRLLADLPEVRFAGTSGGSENLLLDVWLRNLGAIHQLEVAMQKALRRDMRLRREIVLRTPKRLGNLFDSQGLHTGEYLPVLRPTTTLR